MRVLNFGSVNIDHIYAVDHIVTPGETISVQRLDYAAGGKGLNQSIALAKTGIETFHAGCIGSDGHMMSELLKKNHVSTLYLRTCDTVTGHAVIQVNTDGQNSIMILGGANQAISLEQVQNTLSNFTEKDSILMQNEISHVNEIAEMCYDRHIPLFFNPSPITPQLLETFPFKYVSCLLINETEAHDITSESEPQSIINYFLSHYPQMQVVLTLGSKGVIFADKESQIHQPAFHVEAVDTTAAGDTFTGYYMGSYLQGASVKNALLYGCAAAALAVTKKGAAPSIPEKAEVEQFLKMHNNG